MIHFVNYISDRQSFFTDLISLFSQQTAGITNTFTRYRTFCHFHRPTHEFLLCICYASDNVSVPFLFRLASKPPTLQYLYLIILPP